MVLVELLPSRSPPVEAPVPPGMPVPAAAPVPKPPGRPATGPEPKAGLGPAEGPGEGPAEGMEPVCGVPAVVREYAAGAVITATTAVPATTAATRRGRWRTPASIKAEEKPSSATPHLSQGR